MELFDLTGKTALLTGATRGMGLSMAEAMGKAGAKLVISGLEKDECVNAEQHLRKHGIEVSAITCDVADREQIKHLYAQSLELYSKIDVLVCNAGVAPAPGPLASTTEDDWETTLRINLQSQIWLTSMVIPAMAKRRDGAIILTASLSSVRGNKALGLYGITKAGVAQLARNLAVEWGPSNIRVNAISPGVIRTTFAKPLLDNVEAMARRLSLTPLRRIGEPCEVAGVVLMLATKAGAFITGQNVIIDGGTTISDGN